MKTYYVDSTDGDDKSPGDSPDTAWKTIRRAMQQNYSPGDALLFKRGCIWRESLRIKGVGTKTRPITLGTYGGGPKPRLMSSDPAILSNDGPVSWWHIKGLELLGDRNFDPRGKKQGGQNGISITQSVRSAGLVIEDCVVHDIDGKGIVFNAQALRPSVFRDVTIMGCEVYNAGTGIATDGLWPAPAGQLVRYQRCISHFTVRECRVHDIATDGIVLYNCEDSVIEHCTAWRTGIGIWHRTPVGIWLFMARRCIIQYCESFDNHTAGGHADGGGFDLDGGCTDCIMQYNYSHDNDGAGYLVCSYDPAKHPCTRCVVRFNLSVNDGRMNDFAAIQFWQADDCEVYNNTCVTRMAYGLKFASDTKGILFANNLFLINSDRDIPFIKSPFAISANRFSHNLYWRRDGKARFDIQDTPDLSLKDYQRLVRANQERCADPLLSAVSGPDIHPTEGSPAINAGIRLPDPGSHDLYGRKLITSEPFSIGASFPGP